MTRVINLIW